MPTYQSRGEVPRKRHIQFRDNGTLLTEEVMGLEGFTGNESILYHLISPCRVKELGEFQPIEREEWVPDAHAHRHFKTFGTEPEGDEVSGRKLLMWNNDVEISLVRPSETMDYFFRNGEGDEVYFVHEGSGTLHTTFGDVPYREGDYVVIPRGTTYQFEPSGPQRYLLFETPGLIEIPKRYRNEYGQLMEHAPFYHRDIHPPTELKTYRERGDFNLKIRVRDGYQDYVIDYHPFDVVGWDGYLYPWTFNISDFEPITGRIHMPPPSHQTFAGPNFVICSFCPRKLDFDPLAIPIPVPPLESAERGDDLLRRRAVLVAEGDRDRLRDAAPVGDPARAAAGTRGEVDRRDGDARARGDVRHVPPAQALEARRRARRRRIRVLVVRGAGRDAHVRPGSGGGDVAPLSRAAAPPFRRSISRRRPPPPRRNRNEEIRTNE